MSAPDPHPYKNWWQNVVGQEVPWLAGGPVGQAEGNAWPALLDYFLARMDLARKQCFPDYALPDALPHVGNDRKFIQGSNESNASFQVRCKAAFDTWPRAGSSCGVLEQLWYFGIANAYWLQPNGMYDTFNGQTLTPGQDPTSLLQTGNTSALTNILNSSVAPYRAIPAATPWWFVDSNTDMTNRFVILIPSWPFSSLAVANFNNSDSATVTWPVPFGSTSYKVIFGPPTDEVELSNDATAQTTTGTILRASGPWTGSVWIIGFAAGVNPFNTFDTVALGALQRLITTFRPNALCMGVFAIQSGRSWGWPTTVKWGDGGTWGGSASQILGVF